jgi:hypothetical protein
MTTTNGASETALLKTDDLGRVRTLLARRESLLDEYERSGLSGAKFAALAGIKYSTFATWAQRRRRRGSSPTSAKPADSVRWLEAVVEQAQNPAGQKSAGLRLQLPGGAQMEIADEQQAALAAVLVRALAC